MNNKSSRFDSQNHFSDILAALEYRVRLLCPLYRQNLIYDRLDHSCLDLAPDVAHQRSQQLSLELRRSRAERRADYPHVADVDVL